MKWFTEHIIRWCEKRGHVLNITGTDGPDDIYLIRYYVFRSRFFNIFIHRFLRSDRDDLHDHPWNFVTYIVSGAYLEYKWNESTQKVDCVSRIGASSYGAPINRLALRKATDRHKVEVWYPCSFANKDHAPLTICVTGPIKREWGFWRNGQWVDWREYLDLPKDVASRG